MEVLIIFGVIFILFAGLWIGISILLSSSWKKLAKIYPFNKTQFDPKKIKVDYADIDGTKYKDSSMGFYYDKTGVQIKASFPFNFGHPKIFIP